MLIKKFKIVIKVLFTKNKRFLQKLNFLLAHFQLGLKSVYLYSYPVKLTIDPCNFCNLQCVLCPSGSGIQGRKKSYLDFNIFKKLIDECGNYVWEIDMHNWGEPLLNKEVFRMIKYARQKNIDVSMSTNLNFLDKNICADLIESGLNKLIISLDGASQETVEKYQVKNNFNNVLNNIMQVVSAKKKFKTLFPYIQWRFVVNKYNEHEIDKAKQIADKIGVDLLELGCIRCDMGNELLWGSRAQYENVSPWLPTDEKLSIYSRFRKTKKVIKQFCNLLWLESVVQSDGSISPCCAVWHDKFDFGNINTDSFKTIWNNKKYKNARKIMRSQVVEGNDICSICNYNRSIL